MDKGWTHWQIHTPGHRHRGIYKGKHTHLSWTQGYTHWQIYMDIYKGKHPSGHGYMGIYTGKYTPGHRKKVIHNGHRGFHTGKHTGIYTKANTHPWLCDGGYTQWPTHIPCHGISVGLFSDFGNIVVGVRCWGMFDFMHPHHLLVCHNDTFDISWPQLNVQQSLNQCPVATEPLWKMCVCLWVLKWLVLPFLFSSRLILHRYKINLILYVRYL